MPPISVERRAEIALQALSILRAEPGFHAIAGLASRVGAKPADVAAVLHDARLAGSADWSLDLEFGDETDPPQALGADAVRLPERQADALPLPMTDVDLLRLAFMARFAIERVAGTEQARVLAAVQRKLLASLSLDEDLDLAADVPPIVLDFQEARENGRAVSFGYRKAGSDEQERREVTPVGVSRASKGWLLEAFDHQRGERRQFREDRVLGGLTDAGPARAHDVVIEPITAEATRVRLRLPIARQWALESFRPQDEQRLSGSQVEVTISLFPPVEHRLTQLLALLGPEARPVWPLDPAHVEAHRARLRQVLARHRA